MNRNLSAAAKLCKHCYEAGENLKQDIPKRDIVVSYKLKEPNDLVQLDFLGQLNYVKRLSK